MSGIDEVAGKRYCVKTIEGNYYFFVSPQDIMSTVPSENDPLQSESRILLEALCRISSKGMKEVLTLHDIAEQLKKSSRGRTTAASQFAECLESYGEAG